MDIAKPIAQHVIPAHRRALILELVRRQGGASIAQLADTIGTSFSTIRRDLDHLARQGHLERSHGGAVLKAQRRGAPAPGAVLDSLARGAAEAAIGVLAAALVEDGQSVLFDSSPTVLACAESLRARELAVTAVTNDLEIALVLAGQPRHRVVVPGGTLCPGSFTLTGAPGDGFLDGVSADLALIGVHSLGQERLSETSIEVAEIKRRMIRAAQRVVVLADSSRFDHPAFVRVAGLEAVHLVVSDSDLLDEHRRMLESHGIEVLVAPPTVAP